MDAAFLSFRLLLLHIVPGHISELATHSSIASSLLSDCARQTCRRVGDELFTPSSLRPGAAKWSCPAARSLIRRRKNVVHTVNEPPDRGIRSTVKKRGESFLGVSFQAEVAHEVVAELASVVIMA